jgi:hypothetical protein
MGPISVGAISPMMNLVNAGFAIYRARSVVHVPDPAGGTFATRLADLNRVSLGNEAFPPLRRRDGIAAADGSASR